jgi:two-component system OmpR family sensor kinase
VAKATSISLKRQLVTYTSLFSIVMGCLLVIAAYRIALEETNEILDAQMRNLAERVAEHDPAPIKSEFEVSRHYHEEDLFVDVWSYEFPEQREHKFDLLIQPVKKAGFYTHHTAQGLWNTYVLPTEKYQIQVSQQRSVRQKLALELAANMLIPYLLFMPLALWGLNWIIGRSLKPLDEFKAELAQREPHELTAIRPAGYPVEILPTINEMNRLFERISLFQQEQKQFIADAAHELRTPITALNLQMKILLHEFPEHQALKNLSLGLIRIQHLVSQLLNLAKQDASVPTLESVQQVCLSDLVGDCMEQLMELALAKNIDLGLEQQEQIWLKSQSSAVHSIVYNLLDNAIKYTPEQGVINVSIYKQDQRAILQIEDSGPGIAPELYDQILKRFYRVHHHLEVGSGLGLSIVDKAAEKVGAKLNFGQSEALGGLQVQVMFNL